MQRGKRREKHVPKEEEATGRRRGRDWVERRTPLGGEEEAELGGVEKVERFEREKLLVRGNGI